MIKRTVYIGNPYSLAVKNNQLQLSNKTTGKINNLPFDEIGFLILDNRQINITHSVMQKCAEENIAVIFCNATHHPASMTLHLDTNTVQTELFTAQINASEPLKKNLWKQTIQAKIHNQAMLLKKHNKDYQFLLTQKEKVKTGDSDNREAHCSKHYWKHLLPIEGFRRKRDGLPPNQLFNYAYSILRAAVARSLSGSGLLPTLGIHHKNKYNSYCLADDIMEPYRPFVDELILDWILNEGQYDEISKEFKAQSYQLLSCDTYFKNTTRPMMIGLSFTTASLAKCYKGEKTKINYPELK